MFLISSLLDKYYRARLSVAETRKGYYKKALAKELRNSKLGRVALRNLNEMMAQNLSWHREFEEILNGKSYQEAFWESDLGFLWYEGNLRAQNTYFDLALHAIKEKQYRSVLDIGCGWGEFAAKAASLHGVENVLGIDISTDIIQEAQKLYRAENLTFKAQGVAEMEINSDLVTLFGSTDYIPPAEFSVLMETLVAGKVKEIILVNSLRNIDFDSALLLTQAQEIKRYDTGFVQPLKHIAEQLKAKFAFQYSLEKAGRDSMVLRIFKS